MDPHYENRSHGLQTFVIFFVVLTVLSVSLRFWSRSLASKEARQRLHLFWWDDWVALASAIIVLTQLAIELVLIQRAGFGRHISTLSNEQVLLYTTLLYVGDYIFDTALSLTKLSGLLFLSRVFPARANPTWFNIALWTCYGLNTAWLIGAIFGTVFFCDPVQKAWNPFIEGTCGTQLNLFLGSAIPSVVIDFCILLLPVPKIWGLRIGAGKKFGLLIVFILGYSVIVVSIGRLINVVEIGEKLNIDPTWESIPLFFWVTAEPAISIVCACLPAMLPLGRHLAHRYMEPVWSSVTSRYGSRVALKSKSGNFSSGRDPYGTERSKHDDAPPPEDTPAGFEGRQSGDSRRNILGLSSTENAYHADARGGLPSDSDDLIFPLQSIRVENEIRVSTRANSNAG